MRAAVGLGSSGPRLPLLVGHGQGQVGRPVEGSEARPLALGPALFEGRQDCVALGNVGGFRKGVMDGRVAREGNS